MKKGDVIKRRKRVMPAMPNQSFPPSQQGDSSVSPDPIPNISPNAASSIMYNEQTSTTQSESLLLPPAHTHAQMNVPVRDRRPSEGERGHVLEPQLRNHGPPPVDFTALYSRKRTYPDSLMENTNDSRMDLDDRTLPPTVSTSAITAATAALSAATAGASASRLSLSPIPRRAIVSVDPGLAPGESKEAMRARLQVERQKMREQLLAVESELARMEDDA
jgi:hypothetical protein